MNAVVLFGDQLAPRRSRHHGRVEGARRRTSWNLARGGKLRELTYRGDVVPEEPGWFVETQRLGMKGANAFGLWGFGYEPELCPTCISARTTTVPLMARLRMPQSSWEYVIALRFVLGVDGGARPRSTPPSSSTSSIPIS